MHLGFKNYILPATIFLLVAASSQLLADKVLLKDGSVVEGEVFHQTSKFIRIRSGTVVRTIDKTDIKRIIFEETKKLTEEEGQKLQALEQARAEEARRAEQVRLAREAEARKLEEARKKQEEEKTRQAEKPQEITHGGAIWRSAVLPGWGQFYTGRKSKGFAYGTGFALAAGLKLSTAAWATHARRDYLRSVDQLVFASLLVGGPGRTLSGLEFIRLNERQNEFSRMKRNTTIDLYATGILAIVYGANMIDVILYKPGKYSIVSFESDGTQASIVYRFGF